MNRAPGEQAGAGVDRVRERARLDPAAHRRATVERDHHPEPDGEVARAKCPREHLHRTPRGVRPDPHPPGEGREQNERGADSNPKARVKKRAVTRLHAPGCYAATASRAVAASAFANVSSPSVASTRTVSPGWNSPSSSFSASLSTSRFWITRFSGRAP